MSLVNDHGPLLAVAPLLLAIVIIDHRSKRIPDVLSLAALAVAAAVVTGLAIVSEAPDDARAALIGAVSLTSILGTLHLVRPDGLGMGDVKLAMTLGLLLGWTRPSITAVVLMIAWALMAASAVGLATVAFTVRSRRVPLRTLTVPFGPSLCLGTAVAVLAGPLLLPS